MRRVLLFVSYYKCWVWLVGVCLCCLGGGLCGGLGLGVWLFMVGELLFGLIGCLVLCFAFGFGWLGLVFCLLSVIGLVVCGCGYRLD